MERLPYKTKRLEIRPLALSDYQAWFEMHDSAEAPRNKFDWKPWPAKKRTRVVFRKAVLRHRRLAKTDTTYVWNIFLRKTGEMIGHFDISTLNRDPSQSANFGYLIINSYRGQGYAQEALEKLVPAAFRDLKFHRLEASVDLDNKASVRFTQRSGFHREGIKKHYWFQNGRWEDQLIFMTTPELWKKRRKNRPN